jgi:hypothetical protein
MKTGSIPENIRVFARPPIEIKFKWDDIDVSDDVAVNICEPIFVTDSTNAKTQVTAKSWASQARWSWDPTTGERVKANDSYTEFERPNTPMVGIRIIGLVHRGQGGRAYQALIEGKYVFDLREDVLLDIILNDGIGKNGALFGSYIFASVGSQMKLIRVGSLLHEKMIAATDYKTMKKITDLEVGGIYRNKRETVLYLGYTYTRGLHVEWSDGRNVWRGWHSEPRKLLSVKNGKEVKQILTVNISEKEVPKTLKDLAKNVRRYNLNWVYSKPKSFREKVGHIDASVQEILDAMRDAIKPDTSTQDMDTLSYSAQVLNMSATAGYLHPRFAEFSTIS